MKNFQRGDVSLVITIIIGLLIIGVVGFVVWKNVLQEKPAHETPTANQEQVTLAEHANQQPYNDGYFSFNYPATDWQKVPTESDTELVRITTTNYEHEIGMGLKSGASISIYSSEANQSVPELLGAGDVKEITIDGHKAQTYYLAYEGYRLQALVTVDQTGYAISMETSTVPTAQEKEVFNTMLSTLKFL